jgi:predicted NACHT family NTPase
MPRSSRSLRASTAGLEKAKNAFKLKGWTQDYLAGAAGCSRQTINNFFARRNVDKGIFQTICTEFGLEWGEIAEIEAGEEQAVKIANINVFVQEVREKVRPYIQECCGTMRVLDMTQPIELCDIYTDVNILEKITGRRRLEIADLLKNSTPENFDRFSLSRIIEERVPGIQALKQYSKLMVLGKPGAGKTTFLKHLAIQCIEGQFFGDRFPVFITLKDFAETTKKPDILQYISQQLSECDLVDASIKLIQLLKKGKALVLLDGLDEVRAKDDSRVIRQIREFTEQYRENQIVVTCRIAAREYIFKSFVEVEVADFDDQQIKTFAHQWFKLKKRGKTEKFIQKLEEDKPIKELATNPLLLTLLCLIFEEKGKFKTNRSELYEEGIELLLERWDDSRDIEREHIYKNLSTKRKEDLLSKIALTTFESGDYFFKSRNAQQLIADYIQNLPDAQTDPEALLLDSKAVLKSIVAQHGLLVERARGIYSFSHLTFHEFFTAINIDSQQTFQQLVSHITDKRWREVFLLTVGMLKNADNLLLLMKEQIDGLLGTDEKWQEFLTWVDSKSNSVDAFYKKAAIRDFYLALSLDLNFDHSRSRSGSRCFFLDLSLDLFRCLEPNINISRCLDFNLELELSRCLDICLFLCHEFQLDLFPSLSHCLGLDLDRELQHKLQELENQLLFNSQENRKIFEQWWQINGQTWTEQFRNVMIEHRNIGHDWQFSNDQWQLLRQYYNANKLLVDCLNSECYVNRSVRQEIEDTLLLPVNRN